jgi:hypothetical protein
MKSCLRLLFSASLFFVSNYANAGAAYSLKTNANLQVTIDPAWILIGDKPVTPAMIDQIQNQGCFPRGLLDSDSPIRFMISAVGTMQRNSFLEIRLTVCNDPLPASGARTYMELEGYTSSVSGKGFSSKTNVKVSSTFPDGSAGPVRIYSSTQQYRSSYIDFLHYVQGVPNTNVQISETGDYVLKITNPGYIDLNTQFTVWVGASAL